MFRFANIEMLWWLLTIPVFVVAYIAYTKRKRKQLMEFGDPELMSQLMPDASKSRPIWKFCLLMVALILLIFAAARPQFGQKEKTIKRQGIEVMVALDISNSMMAEDVAPNRLDRAKQMLSKMMDNMVDDKVGLVVFAGEGFYDRTLANSPRKPHRLGLAHDFQFLNIQLERQMWDQPLEHESLSTFVLQILHVTSTFPPPVTEL